MRRILKFCAFSARATKGSLYVKIITYAYSVIGVKFVDGLPTYIHYNAELDASGGLFIGRNVVISIDALILTHDYSCRVGVRAFLKSDIRGSEYLENERVFNSVNIGNDVFVGAHAIIFPGSIIGDYSIIGAGTVVKGNIPPYSIVVGNPSKIIGDTRIWGSKFCEIKN